MSIVRNSVYFVQTRTSTMAHRAFSLQR